MQANVTQALKALSADLIQVSDELSAIEVKDPDLLALRAQGVLLSEMLIRTEFSENVVDEQIEGLTNLVNEYREIAVQAIGEFTQAKQ